MTDANEPVCRLREWSDTTCVLPPRMSISPPAPDPSVPLVTIGDVKVYRDGTVTFPPGTNLDETSQTFWHALGRSVLSVRSCSRCGGVGIDPGHHATASPTTTEET